MSVQNEPAAILVNSGQSEGERGLKKFCFACLFLYQNEKPVFLVRNGYILNYNYIGEEAKHVRFSLDFPGLTSVNCILFQRAGEYEGIIHKGIRVDVVGYIEKNKFNGNVNIQIKVIDIKRAGEFTKERVE